MDEQDRDPNAEMRRVFMTTVLGLREIGHSLGDDALADACHVLARSLTRRIQSNDLPQRRSTLSLSETASFSVALMGRAPGQG